MINCVVSRYNKNTDWVYKLDKVDKFFIYDKMKPTNPYNVPVNKGNEASVYLKYIIDHYNDLADYTFFVHDEEYSWHHSGTIEQQLNYALDSNQKYYNINDQCVLGSILSHRWYGDILSWYDTYIEKYIPISSLPSKDFTQNHRGSAQFLVHKSILTSLPLEFYVNLYNWIITTPMENGKSGRFLEWTWHIFWDVYPTLKN
jgi:hypothetical protein